MNKFDGILVCTDLDGTLLNDNSAVSRENLEAIEYFKSEGGRFTFITGRMHFFATDFYKEVGANAPFGCINGGGIYDCDNSRYVWRDPIDRSVLELVEYVDERIEGMGIQINTFEHSFFKRQRSTGALPQNNGCSEYRHSLLGGGGGDSKDTLRGLRRRKAGAGQGAAGRSSKSSRI